MKHHLLDRTMVLLKECPLPLPEIARGADVGFEWLKKLKAGEIPEPGVNRIQRLHDFLVLQAAAA